MKSEFDLVDFFPKFVEGEKGYGIEWRVPDFYKRHKDKICRCANLQDSIVRKCQIVLNSGAFGMDEVKIRFLRGGGFNVGVPGTHDCCVYLLLNDSCGYHNIDTSHQCFSLLFFVFIILEEIYKFMIIWDKNPDIGLIDWELEECEYSYKLKRSLQSKPFTVWKIADGELPTDDEMGVVLARTDEEAKKEVGNLLGNWYRVVPRFILKPEIFSSLRAHEVVVTFKDERVPCRVYKIFACDLYHAEKIMEKMLNTQSFLWPIKEIKISDEGSVIKPSIMIKEFEPVE